MKTENITLKTEFLILISNEETFCGSKKAFLDFLNLDGLISVVGQKIAYRKSPKARDLVSVRFNIEMGNVKFKQERYFLLALECDDFALIEDFSELGDKLKSIAERISPGATTVNTLWDGVGRFYAEKAYPIINEVENLMRQLIAKFMLITVGVNWSKDAIHPELFKKIENFEDEKPYLNDLYKLDFIHLSQVLFDKKRDISLEELDRLLAKTEFNDEDKEKIRRYVPRSNWEKYFASLIDEKDFNLQKKWELLYKLRNKVAHNRNIKKAEFEQIKGLATNIKRIIETATAKLSKINMNEEERDFIIHSYQSNSPAAMGFLSEKAVAGYYERSGYEVESDLTFSLSQCVDFFASKNSKRMAVKVKFVQRGSLFVTMKMAAHRLLSLWAHHPDFEKLDMIHLVYAMREYDFNYSTADVIKRAEDLMKVLGSKFEIHLGYLNEENVYVPFGEACHSCDDNG